MKVVLVAGGAGFIGSNFTRYFLQRNKNFIAVSLDKLTQSGCFSNIKDLENSPRFQFIKGDLCNHDFVNYVIRKYKPEYIMNFAGESDHSRSMSNPTLFSDSNITGTMALLEGARSIWCKGSPKTCRFIQVSTTDVYGSSENTREFFDENSPICPSTPYAASKAAADIMALSYNKCYNLPVIITRSCANYGAFQHHSRFIPSCIINALEDRSLIIPGDGQNTCEWMHVIDHSIALIRTMFYGKPGMIYNIGSGEATGNADIAKRILTFTGKSKDRIKFANSSYQIDKRCIINSYKARSDLGWSSKTSLDDGLKLTINWYKSNRDMWS